MIKPAIVAAMIACGVGVHEARSQTPLTASTGSPRVAAASAAASTAASAALQTVTVTGSYIRRDGAPLASPLQVLTAQDLADSGYTDLSDILQQLPANGAGALSQAFDQAFAAGGAGLALRGLTVGDTLVLVDGERMVSYPLADDNERSFVDLSAIPLGAVERVEVLKDGASALYGADAIAGVVNVILRRAYTGFTATADVGDSEEGDGTLAHFSALAGTGDLATDGYNAYVALELRHQDPVLDVNRSGEYTRLDWTPYGGVDTTPGSTGDPLANGGYPLSLSGYLIDPATGARSYLPGCDAARQAAGACEFSFAGLQIQPRTQSLDVLGRFTKRLGGSWQASVSASIFASRAEQVAADYPQTSYPYGGLTAIPFAPGVPPAIGPTSLITAPPDYPGNPTGATEPLEQSLAFLGVPQYQVTTRTYRLMAAATGSAAGWAIDAHAGIMDSRMSEDEYGNPDAAALQAAINSAAGQTGSSQSAASLAAAAASIAPVDATEPTSELYLLEVHGTRTLLRLPGGGPLAAAAGVQYFDSILDARAPAAVASGVQIGNAAYAIGSQSDTAAFLELDAAPIPSLDATGAVRYDHYDTYGGSATSKLGLQYSPVRELTLRGTWGQGFRAPSIAEAGQSGELFAAGAARDPVLCPHPANPESAGNFPSQCSAYLIGFQAANPALSAVHSTEVTAGFVARPTRGLKLAADYYRIELSNDIISAFEAGGLADFASLVRGSPAALSYCTADGDCASTRMTPVGLPIFAEYAYVNAGETRTDGWDLDARLPLDLGAAGRLTARLDYAHTMSYVVSFRGASYELAGTHGPSGISGDTGNPKDRAMLVLTWARGPLAVTATVHYTGSFSITDPSAGLDTCVEALTESGTAAYGVRFSGSSPIPGTLCTVHSFTGVDLHARYALGEHVSVHASVLDLLDTPPPLDLQTYGGGGELAYDPAFAQAGAIGRFFMVGMTYTF